MKLLLVFFMLMTSSSSLRHFPLCGMYYYCIPLEHNNKCDVECLTEYSEVQDCVNDVFHRKTLNISVVVTMSRLEFYNFVGVFTANVQMATKSQMTVLTDISSFNDEWDVENSYVIQLSIDLQLTMRECEDCTEESMLDKIYTFKPRPDLSCTHESTNNLPLPSPTPPPSTTEVPSTTEDPEDPQSSHVHGLHPTTSPETASSHVVFILSVSTIGILMTIIVGILMRTRKRRSVTAPIWHIPALEEGDKDKYSSREKIYATPSRKSAKRARMEETVENLNEIIDRRDQGPTVVLPPLPPHCPTQLHHVALSINPNNEQQYLMYTVELIAHGIDMNAQDGREETALFIAVKRDQIGLAKLLLDYGADGNIMNCSDSTLLHQAVHNLNLEMVLLLLRYERIKNSLVDGRRSIDSIDERGRTCLMVCAEYEPSLAIPIAKALIRAGANPADNGDKNLKHFDGRTMLHCAVMACNEKNMDMVKYVIAIKRVDINAEDYQGCTPLWLATFSGKIKTVHLLLKNGAVSCIPDHMDHYPIDVARVKGFMDIADLLEKHKKTNLRKKTQQKKRKVSESESSDLSPPVSPKKPLPMNDPKSGVFTCSNTISPYYPQMTSYNDHFDFNYSTVPNYDNFNYLYHSNFVNI